VTRQARAAWWAIPLVAGLLLLFVGVLIGFHTPDAAEQVPGGTVQYACGSPFTPGRQRAVPACKTSLDGRRWKAETALVLGGLLVVLGAAIAFVQRDRARDRMLDHELRPAS
jgi:hypothetical protein